MRVTKSDYEGVCKTVADMHAAAVGEVRGPDVGLVEDVAALHRRALDAETAIETAIAFLDPENQPSQWTLQEVLDALRHARHIVVPR